MATRDEAGAPTLRAASNQNPPEARAVTAWATGDQWSVALAQAVSKISADATSPPDVLVLFASVAYLHHADALLARLHHDLHPRTLIGCSVQGFICGANEREQVPGLSLMALWLPGANLHTMHLMPGSDAITARASWQDDTTSRGWLMLAEPFRTDALPLIHALKGAMPCQTIFGGMASHLDRETTGVLFLNHAVHREGAVALGIGGDWEIAAAVSQGCFPFGEAWTITGVERSALTSISGRSAGELLSQSLDSLSPEQRDRAQNNLTVGLAVDEYLDHYEGGDFFVRGILAVDPKRGSLVVSGRPRVGQTVQFHLRDPASAHEDLQRVTTTLHQSGPDPLAAITCTCAGRGESLFQEPGHDAETIVSAMPGVPLIGAFCPGEIGPLGKTTVIHSLTATTGVIRRHVPPVA